MSVTLYKDYTKQALKIADGKGNCQLEIRQIRGKEHIRTATTSISSPRWRAEILIAAAI
jgi:hypothetical protein